MASYELKEGKTYKIDEDGERTMLANFTASIDKETRYVDGPTTDTILSIRGQAHNGEKVIDLSPVDVPSSVFASMSWVMNAWGVRAILMPGGGTKEDMRTAIQINSRPNVETIYKATGWTLIGKKWAFLHAGGAVFAKGNDPKIKVDLPTELSKYNLVSDATPAEAFAADLRLVDCAPAEVTWTMLAACYAPLFGNVDFGTHLTGRSGTFKSELISLFQSHYGPEMDARHLPGSWSSTGNALEAQAFTARNCPFVIDDFVPNGTSWQVKAYQTNADKIVRAQGNQAGRARLTDLSNLQAAYYPRGIIMSTGEDTPEGHSVRARLMITELSPGDVDPKKLTVCQQDRPKYAAMTQAIIKYLCVNDMDLKPRIDQIRDANLSVGHTRTPPMIGRLVATIEAVLQIATELNLQSATQEKNRRKAATAAIMAAASKQQGYLETSDPVEVFQSAIRATLQSLKAHIRKLNGGIPNQPTILGWTAVDDHSDMPTYKSHGPCIGWIDWDHDEIFIEINAGYEALRKAAGGEITISKQTMFKRLKDAGVLTRIDENRQRNTVRVTAENHPRQVIALSIASTFQTQEVPQDGEEEIETGSNDGGTTYEREPGIEPASGISDGDPFEIPE